MRGKGLLSAGLLFGVAFGVRLIGIGWGLPNAQHHFSYHPDEWLVLAVSYFNLNPYAGDWLPHFYNYGSLPLYLWSLWLHWLTAVGVLPALSENASALQIAEWRAAAHLWARVLVALMGAGAALAMARTMARLAGERAGWIAGLAMAFAPAFVVHSRFQTVDVPTTFFVALACWSSVALFGSERPLRTLLWGAVWAGCAAGCKYNAGLVMLAPLVSLWLRAQGERWAIRRRLGWTVGAIGVALGVFLLVCPGTWVEPQAFWRDFRYELLHVQRGHGEIFTQTGLGWLFHIRPNLTVGFGVLPLLFSLLGWLMVGIRRREVAGVLVASLAYFLLIGAAEVRFLRYTFPLFPMLGMGVGWASTLSLRLPFQRRMMGGGSVMLAIFALAWQLAWTAALTACMLRPDPREQTLAWFEAHVPSGRTIAFPTVPWFYTPPFYPDTGELRWQDRLQRMHEAQSPYRLIALAPPEWDAEALQWVQPDYVVISDFEERDVRRIGRADYRAFMTVLQRDYRLVRVFRNDPRP
ncbi:MAG: glycosyltransferase family 39 protein, partial [Fimbriimonadales bacterium]|nr:glycosyltransferase family 39 protein [Fimbriimonadales bacterium]